MIKTLQNLNQASNRHLAKLCGLATGAAIFYNWRTWQRDKMLVAQLRQDKHTQALPELSHTPKVSVLVAAWNEHTHIDAHLQSFLGLSYPNIELIICAGGTDDTLQRAHRYAGKQVIVLEQKPGEGKQHALARCYECATGEIIYLTDADCLYNDAALYRLLYPLVEEGEEAATGTYRPLDEQLTKLLPLYLWSSTTVASVGNSRYIEGLQGANAVVTRAALERAGGMNFAARTGTDYQLAKRLVTTGTVIRYISTSVIASVYPETLAIYRRQQTRWLRNLLLYGRRYGAKQDVRVTIKTVATGVTMLIIPLTAPLTGGAVLIPWSGLVAHAVSSKFRYALFTARLYQYKVPWQLKLSLVPLTLLDFAIWALPAFDLLTAKRREQW